MCWIRWAPFPYTVMWSKVADSRCSYPKSKHRTGYVIQLTSLYSWDTNTKKLGKCRFLPHTPHFDTGSAVVITTCGAYGVMGRTSGTIDEYYSRS